jgi:hypothetical protein
VGTLAVNTSHLSPKGKNKTRKLHIWHTTRKQMNKQGAFDVQITRNGYR